MAIDVMCFTDLKSVHTFYTCVIDMKKYCFSKILFQRMD